jgi:hypothetical protein
MIDGMARRIALRRNAFLPLGRQEQRSPRPFRGRTNVWVDAPRGGENRNRLRWRLRSLVVVFGNFVTVSPVWSLRLGELADFSASSAM